MKKVIITVIVTFAIALMAVILAFSFLGPKKNPTPAESSTPPSAANTDPSTATPAPEDTNPIKVYDNGIATFTYDNRKVYFDEMPSNNTDGTPQTWFFLSESDSALPSVAAYPMTLEKPFSSSITNEDWEELAKAYIMSYFSPDVQGLVTVGMNGTVVKIDGDTAKMYVAFDCDVASSPANNINGVVRLIANANNAMVTVAVTADGQSLPECLVDVYMSVVLN